MENSSIPTKDQCMYILKKYKTPNTIIQHCLAVTGIVEEFCLKIPQVNRKIAIAGAMLHDIGRTITHSISHAINGVKILEKENIDSRIIAIVRNHIGTGIVKEEAKKLGLPPEDYIPETLEEEIVSYSDNLTSGNDQCSFEETLDHFIQEFGKESHVVQGFFRQKKLLDSLIKLNKL